MKTNGARLTALLEAERWREDEVSDFDFEGEDMVEAWKRWEKRREVKVSSAHGWVKVYRRGRTVHIVWPKTAHEGTKVAFDFTRRLSREEVQRIAHHCQGTRDFEDIDEAKWHRKLHRLIDEIDPAGKRMPRMHDFHW